MSEPNPIPSPRSMLAHALAAGRHGAGEPTVHICERQLSVVQVMVRKGREENLHAASRAAFGSEPPGPGQSLRQGEVTTIWIGPGTWLVTEPWKTEGALARRIGGALGDHVSIVDQTYGKAAIRLSGAKARDVLAKGCRLDLHPRAFAPGRVAVTPVAHINTVLVLVDDAPTFDLIVPATLAESFLGWLCESAAGVGYTTAPA